MSSSSPILRFVVGLALGLLLTVVAVGLNLVPVLQQTGAIQAATRLIVIALVLVGLWRGLERLGVPRQTRLVRWLSVGVVLLAWQMLVWVLAFQGVFLPSSPFGYLLPAAIFLPLIIGLPLLLRSAWLGRVLDAIPPTWLVGLQVYRVFGSIFVLGWIVGQLPGVFALPAGLGDTLVGILALPVAGVVSRTRYAGVAWNVLGILDLIDAVALGVLTSPGRLQLIVPDHTTLIGAYPLVLIPAFAVPLSALLHAVSLRQLRRLAQRADSAQLSQPTAPAQIKVHSLQPSVLESRNV
jgi:hypothetical protein